MKGVTEKSLLSVGGSPIVKRVLDALYGSYRFGSIVAAVSPKTPDTRKFLTSAGVQVLETSGKGYSCDLSLVLTKLRPARVFVISADMPLITSHIVGEIVSAPQTKPLLSVVLRKEFVESLGFSPSVTFKEGGSEYCQSGISIFDVSRQSADDDYYYGGRGGDGGEGGSSIGNGSVTMIEEEHLVMDRIEVAANVNTKEELRLAEKLLIQRA